MREILFRGKDEDTGEWLQSMTISKHYYNDEEIFSYYIGHGNRTIDAKTLGQYTGLTDKNGTKIFEGDICRNTKTGEIVSVKWHGTMAGYVWSGQKENCKHLFEFGALFRAYDKYEVIGNIHDNPELMKGGAE